MRAERYFAVNPDQCKNFRAVFVPENDVLPLDELPNCKQLCKLSDGRALLHVLFGDIQIQNVREIAEVENPLTMEAIDFLGLTNSYVGMTPDEVQANTDEDLTKTVTYEDPENGETVTKTVNLLNHEWR